MLAYSSVLSADSTKGSVFFSKARNEWRAQFPIVVNGEKKRKLLTGFRSEDEARRQMILAQPLARGEIQIPAYEIAAARIAIPDVLFSEHIRRYLKFISCHGSSRSLKDKVRLLGLIEERLGQYKLGELNLNILQDFLNE